MTDHKTTVPRVHICTLPISRISSSKFWVRVGNDGQEIGNNAICYKQLESVESGIAKNFTCSPPIFGNWISVNKSTNDAAASPLHFHEIRVFSGKYTLTPENCPGLSQNPIRHIIWRSYKIPCCEFGCSDYHITMKFYGCLLPKHLTNFKW